MVIQISPRSGYSINLGPRNSEKNWGPTVSWRGPSQPARTINGCVGPGNARQQFLRGLGTAFSRVPPYFNHCPHAKEQFWGEGQARTCSDMSGNWYTQSESTGEEPVLRGCWLGCTGWGHIGATWRIRLNRPCAAVLRPHVKLLRPVILLWFGD